MQPSKDLSELEAQTPGVGGPASGKSLKKYTQEILSALDIDITEDVYDKKDAKLMMPECEWDNLKLLTHFADMEGPDFW